jgi:hypothetical protein
VPKGRKVPGARRKLACQMLDEGRTVAEAARVAGVPESSVWNWAAEMRSRWPRLWYESRGRIPTEPESEPEPPAQSEPELSDEAKWRKFARLVGRGSGVVSDGPPEDRLDVTGWPRHERLGGRDER